MQYPKEKPDNKIETLSFALVLIALILGLCVTYLSQPTKETSRMATPASDKNM